MIELARYRCPECSTVFDVWLEDGVPEDVAKTRCPRCIPKDADSDPVYGLLDEEEGALWSDEAPDEFEEISMTPTQVELLQLAEELGVNLQDPNADIFDRNDIDELWV